MGFGGRPRLGGVCFGVYFQCSVYIRRRCSVVLCLPVSVRLLQRPG
jgi:hypothetical protein